MNNATNNTIENIKSLLKKCNDIEIDCTKNNIAYSRTLSTMKSELEKALRELEFQKKHFDIEMESKQRNYESQMKLFEMKWKILEDETRRLAEDSRKMELKKSFYERVNNFNKTNSDTFRNDVVKGEMFFRGITNRDGLRKRYRELTKIYHPDVEFGDKQTIQEINREYNLLKDKYLR